MDSLFADIFLTIALIALIYILQRRELPKSKHMALRNAKTKYKVMTGRDVTEEFL